MYDVTYSFEYDLYIIEEYSLSFTSYQFSQYSQANWIKYYL